VAISDSDQCSLSHSLTHSLAHSLNERTTERRSQNKLKCYPLLGVSLFLSSAPSLPLRRCLTEVYSGEYSRLGICFSHSTACLPHTQLHPIGVWKIVSAFRNTWFYIGLAALYLRIPTNGYVCTEREFAAVTCNYTFSPMLTCNYKHRACNYMTYKV